MTVKTKTAASKTRLHAEQSEALVKAYIQNREQAKAIEQDKVLLQDALRTAMGTLGTLETPAGNIIIQVRTSLSWSMTALQESLPTEWTSFVTPDNKLLKVKAEDVPALMDAATVTTTDALVVKQS